MTNTQPAWAEPSKPAEKPVETLDQKLARWYTLKADVARLTADESALRMEIFGEAFKNPPEKGTVRHSIGYGKDLKATCKLNYSIDKQALEVAKVELPADVLAQVLKYKPEVNEAGLNAITDPKHKALVASFVTSKPGLPSLEIVDVKKR